MEDNKRIILALVLSMVLLMVYSQFFSPGDKTEPSPQQPQVPADSSPAYQGSPQAKARTAPPPPTHLAPGLTPPSAQTALSPAKASLPTVTVETPLATIVLSSKGGSLQKVTLKKYFNEAQEKGGNYQLLDLNPAGPLSAEFALPPVDPYLAQRTFKPDKSLLKIREFGAPDSISFRAVSGGLAVTKTYSFRPDSYAFNLNVTVENLTVSAREVNPQLALTEVTSKDSGNVYAFTGMELYKNGDFMEFDADDLLDDQPVESGAIQWISLNIPYFMGAAVPLGADLTALRTAKGISDKKNMTAMLIEPTLRLGPGEAKQYKYLIYLGPKDLKHLSPIGHNLDKALDFGWFDVIAKPMLWLLNWLYSFIGNYGIAIIIVTFLTKVLFFPLAQKSYKSMNQMRKLGPQMNKIREKYKHDKQRMNQEVMQLYKTYKVNPMGSCLPMLVQIPVFIAFYKVLGTAIEMRHAPFMLWINDLASPDRLNIGFEIPWVGGLPVLTVLMGASMFITQKMTPSPGGDPTQQKIMMLMPLIFTFMFISFPSGLVLYWLTQNLLSIVQQYWTNKQNA